MTTYTSNGNECNGKTFGSLSRSNRVTSVKEHSNAGGYVLVIALLAVAYVLFAVVIPALS